MPRPTWPRQSAEKGTETRERAYRPCETMSRRVGIVLGRLGVLGGGWDCDFLLETERRSDRRTRESASSDCPQPAISCQDSAPIRRVVISHTIVLRFPPERRCLCAQLSVCPSRLALQSLASRCQLLRHYTIAHHVGQVDSVCRCHRRARERENSSIFISNLAYAVLLLSTATRYVCCFDCEEINLLTSITVQAQGKSDPSYAPWYE